MYIVGTKNALIFISNFNSIQNKLTRRLTSVTNVAYIDPNLPTKCEFFLVRQLRHRLALAYQRNLIVSGDAVWDTLAHQNGNVDSAHMILLPLDVSASTINKLKNIYSLSSIPNCHCDENLPILVKTVLCLKDFSAIFSQSLPQSMCWEPPIQFTNPDLQLHPFSLGLFESKKGEGIIHPSIWDNYSEESQPFQGDIVLVKGLDFLTPKIYWTLYKLRVFYEQAFPITKANYLPWIESEIDQEHRMFG